MLKNKDLITYSTETEVWSIFFKNWYKRNFNGNLDFVIEFWIDNRWHFKSIYIKKMLRGTTRKVNWFFSKFKDYIIQFIKFYNFIQLAENSSIYFYNPNNKFTIYYNFLKLYSFKSISLKKFNTRPYQNLKNYMMLTFGKKQIFININSIVHKSLLSLSYGVVLKSFGDIIKCHKSEKKYWYLIGVFLREWVGDGKKLGLNNILFIVGNDKHVCDLFDNLNRTLGLIYFNTVLWMPRINFNRYKLKRQPSIKKRLFKQLTKMQLEENIKLNAKLKKI